MKSAASTEQPAEFIYGYSEEMMAAFRRPAGRPLAPPEYALTLKAVDANDDEACATAVFADETTWEVPSVTCGELRHQLSNKAPNATMLYWEGKCKDGSAVKLKSMNKPDGKTFLARIYMFGTICFFFQIKWRSKPRAIICCFPGLHENAFVQFPTR
jgi:hypothetical protein